MKKIILLLLCFIALNAYSQDFIYKSVGTRFGQDQLQGKLAMARQSRLLVLTNQSPNELVFKGTGVRVTLLYRNNKLYFINILSSNIGNKASERFESFCEEYGEPSFYMLADGIVRRTITDYNDQDEITVIWSLPGGFTINQHVNFKEDIISYTARMK